MKTPHWLRIALAEKMVSELAGGKHNLRILQYQMSTTLKATSDEVPWCAAFVCWVLDQAKLPSTKSSAARSYLKYGVEVKDPYPGCIVVISRGDNPQQGHVGFFIGQNEQHVFIFGGNQGNCVCLEAFDKSRVLAYRAPEVK